MELKQRKKINNMPKFNDGADLASMIGSNAPAGSAIAGVGSSSASLILDKNHFQNGIQKAEFSQQEAHLATLMPVL